MDRKRRVVNRVAKPLHLICRYPGNWPEGVWKSLK